MGNRVVFLLFFLENLQSKALQKRQRLICNVTTGDDQNLAGEGGSLTVRSG
jgi:hypothetical protein